MYTNKTFNVIHSVQLDLYSTAKFVIIYYDVITMILFYVWLKKKNNNVFDKHRTYIKCIGDVDVRFIAQKKRTYKISTITIIFSNTRAGNF